MYEVEMACAGICKIVFDRGPMIFDRVIPLELRKKKLKKRI
jgi:hypothetical protein